VLLVALRLIDRPSLVETMLLGALIGLAALTRSEGLLLLPLLAIPIAIVAAGRRLRVLAVLVGACALVLSPWVIRNWADFGRPTLSTNDGTTLAGANCQPTYYGNQIGGFSEACLGPVPAGANEAEVSSARRHNALRYAQAHLGRASVIAVVRVLRMWGFYDPLSHANLDGRSRPLSTLGALLLFPLLALGVVGAVILRHRRPLALVVLLAPVLAATVTAAATYGLLRLRHEADVAVLVLAGVAAARWRVAPISAPRPSRTTAEVDLRR
jgi:hypothetical protein